MAALEILYESGPCVVLNKPPGVLTQAPAGIDSLEVQLKALLKDRDRKEGNIYLGVPHRLDRPVSGAIVFARHSRAAKRISKQFEARQIKKLYWAVVEGQLAPREDTWRDFVRKIPDRPVAEIVPQDHLDAREAVLHYRVLARLDGATLLEVSLETGRMHQIRLQASVRGHPVLGDAMYGSSRSFGPQHEDGRLRAIALHARLLEFRHPMTRELASIVAPLPPAWRELPLDA